MYPINREAAVSGGELLQSSVGEFAASPSLAIGSLAYFYDANAVQEADNSDFTTQAVVVVIGKPTSTTATVAYNGRVSAFFGLVPGSMYFLGVNGALIAEGDLPTGSGSIIQQIGVAANSTTLIFEPTQVVIL